MLRVWLRWANTPTCLSSLCHWLALELCDHRRQQTSMIINLLEKISWSLSLFLLWLFLSQQTQDHIYTVSFLEACPFLISPVKSWEINKNEREIIKSVPPALLSRLLAIVHILLLASQVFGYCLACPLMPSTTAWSTSYCLACLLMLRTTGWSTNYRLLVSLDALVKSSHTRGQYAAA